MFPPLLQPKPRLQKQLPEVITTWATNLQAYMPTNLFLPPSYYPLEEKTQETPSHLRLPPLIVLSYPPLGVQSRVGGSNGKVSFSLLPSLKLNSYRELAQRERRSCLTLEWYLPVSHSSSEPAGATQPSFPLTVSEDLRVWPLLLFHSSLPQRDSGYLLHPSAVPSLW